MFSFVLSLCTYCSGCAFLTVIAEKHMHRPKLQEFFPGSRIINHHTMKQYRRLGVEGMCMLDLSVDRVIFIPKERASTVSSQESFGMAKTQVLDHNTIF